MSVTNETPVAVSEKPVVLVTGTSTGIGLSVAVTAAMAGWRVIATVRRVGSDAELRSAAAVAGVDSDIDVRMLDTTHSAAAASLVAEVAETYGRLDAVVNNAGSGHVGTVEED